MKQFISILVLQLLCWFQCYGQPIINERYVINETISSVFSTVISTDSCYYVSWLQTDVSGFANFKSSLIRFNFDGSISSFNEIANDTLGISFFNSSQMIKSLDGNFVHLAVAKEADFPITYL